MTAAADRTGDRNLLDDLSATPSEVEKIVRWVKDIKPDRIQINTATRPPADKSARAASGEKLEELARILGDRAEVIAEFIGEEAPQTPVTAGRSDILALLQRRPCTMQDIVEGLRIHRIAAIKYINELVQSCEIEVEKRGETLYYKVWE